MECLENDLLSTQQPLESERQVEFDQQELEQVANWAMLPVEKADWLRVEQLVD